MKHCEYKSLTSRITYSVIDSILTGNRFVGELNLKVRECYILLMQNHSLPSVKFDITKYSSYCNKMSKSQYKCYNSSHNNPNVTLHMLMNKQSQGCNCTLFYFPYLFI